VLLFSLSFHESAHALSASWMGDETAREQGRISLNPIDHIDIIGTVVMPLAMIFWGGIPMLAWAKPTPVNPRNFRQMAKGQVLVAGAGPASNIILALVFTAVLFVARRVAIPAALVEPLSAIITAGVIINVGLAVFNMVPLPPLDGSWIASWGLPRSIAVYYDRYIQPYGMWILLALVFTNALSYILSPFIGLILTVLMILVR
jgi:Zn-dependent protease